MKEIHRLIYGKIIFYYNCEFVPQIRPYCIVLWSKWHKFTEPLTFHPARSQQVNPLSNVQFVFHPRLVSKSWKKISEKLSRSTD